MSTAVFLVMFLASPEALSAIGRTRAERTERCLAG